MISEEVRNFKYGTIDKIEAESIPSGAASSSLNWLTMGDHIELRRGFKIIGNEDETPGGRVTGFCVAKKANGTNVIFKSCGKKVFYLNTSNVWVEIGSDILGAAADGEDVTFDFYTTNAGNQLFFSSPNSSLFKILIANPESYIDVYDAAKNFKGHIKIGQNRMFLWGRVADKTAVYGSYVDKMIFTSVASENIGTGDGLVKTFNEVLDFKAAGAKRSCFAISVTDGVETFSDDYNGVLTGSLGGTGTINYTTGAISITFKTQPALSAAILASYQWEDPTNNGIADFTKSFPRLAGEGFIFRQDDNGGDIQNVIAYNNIEYCLHQFKTWELAIGNDDTSATNLIFRERVGIPGMGAAVPTGDGIYYIDFTDENKPQMRLLTLSRSSDRVIPIPVSDSKIDLSNYLFNGASGEEWNDFISFFGRTKNSLINNRVVLYNKSWRCFDVIDYFLSKVSIDNGNFLGGESCSNNIVQIFSGFDDNGSSIDNFWEGNLTDHQLSRLKKTKKFYIQGLISKNQSIDVYLSFDKGAYTYAGTVYGSGSYVDVSNSVNIGMNMVGSKTVGGGLDGVLAYNYEKEIKINTAKYEKVKVKFVAREIGYASVSTYAYRDIRKKNSKLPSKYR